MSEFSWDTGQAIIKLEEQKKECLKIINSIADDNFNPNLSSVKWNCSKYLRWRETAYNLIDKFVGPEEAGKFNSIKEESAYSSINPYDFSALRQDWNQLGLFLHNLTGALANDEIEINSEAVVSRRFNILYKLHEMTHGSNKKEILLYKLAEALNMDELIVGSTLLHWATKKGFVKVNLKEKNTDTVELTILGKNEIEKKILGAKPSFLAANQEEKDVKEIFFSYAWADASDIDQSRETIVNDLYESLSLDGYKLIRDKHDLNYRNFISDFMLKIGNGEYIIVAITEKYLKSPYCMFELYEIARNCSLDKYKFSEKVLPIMIDFIDFSRVKVLDEYFSYWEAQYNEWDTFVKRRADQLAIDQLQRFDKIRMVYQNFGKLTEWLIDMNTLNPMLLSKDNFAEIKKALKTRKGFIKS